VKRRVSFVGIGAVAALLLAGCSSAGDGDEGSPDDATLPSSTARALPSDGLEAVSLPVAAGADVDGVVTVDGHDLAVHCTGSGMPTVVILHGWIDEPGVTSFDYYRRLMQDLKPDFRVCSYDRANVGDSEVIAGPQTPEMVVDDLDGLMSAIGDDGPYVLVGQSAGGMVASAYAVAHPEKVAGIVMVDASFDELITIEDVGMVPDGVGACDPANRKLDAEESLQKIDNCAMYKWAYERRDLRPAVPLVYLAAQKKPWNELTEFGSQWTESIIPLQESYAASWSPGKFEWVDSGHDIHAEKPQVVGDTIRWVVNESDQ